jgi:hypothetical protein
MAVQQGRRRRKHRRRSISHPPTPSCQDSLFSKWASLRMLSRRRTLLAVIFSVLLEIPAITVPHLSRHIAKLRQMQDRLGHFLS